MKKKLLELAIVLFCCFLVQGARADQYLSTDAFVNFFGEAEDDWLGRSIASAGDVNNDGYEDIIIGANATSTGSAYLIYGSSDLYTGAISLNNINYAEFKGNGSENAGYVVSSAGDVDNDGFSDILIAAPSNDMAKGAVYLIYGKSDKYAGNILLENIEIVKFQGEQDSDAAGWSISSAGDVNSDNYDDFIIGAYGNDDGGNNSGAAYLIYGKADNYLGDYSLSLPIFGQFYGESEGDYAGVAVSLAGDVNADGYDDFLIGAQYDGR